MMIAAPTTGPKIVPRPPSRVIRTTSPDIVQWTSVSEAKLEHERLGRAGQAGDAAEMTKASSL